MPKQLPWNQPIAEVHAWVQACQSNRGGSTAGARLAVARQYGFATWRQLEAYVTHPGGLSDFLLLGCLAYFQTDRPENVERARKMLKDDPALGTRDIWSAACVGDVAAVAAFLDADPALVHRRGGYFDWEPLLYACYSRLNLPGKSTLAVAGLFIEYGADPNNHYMWGGQYRFTALTGAFGEGEMGPVNQPPHEQCIALAGLLLDAGADPNDGQALYNTMFTPGSECLTMLLEHGLGPMHKCNWLIAAEDGEYGDHPDQTLGYQLSWAVRKHHPDRAKLLIDHGADLAIRTPDDRTMYEAASIAGHAELARTLVEHGAEAVELGSAKRLTGACMAADATVARALLDAEPGMIERLQQVEPDLLVDAAGSNRQQAIRLMADLGFDLGRLGDVSPLHQAAFAGHLGMVELLVGKGADLTSRDKHFAATPLQWAMTGGHPEIVDYLSRQAIGIFDAVLAERLDRLGDLLDADPRLLETTIRAERTDDDPHDSDWQTPLAFAVLRERPAAVKLLLGRGARVDVADGDGRVLTRIARDESTSEIAGLLGSA